MTSHVVFRKETISEKRMLKKNIQTLGVFKSRGQFNHKCFFTSRTYFILHQRCVRFQKLMMSECL